MTRSPSVQRLVLLATLIAGEQFDDAALDDFMAKARVPLLRELITDERLDDLGLDASVAHARDLADKMAPAGQRSALSVDDDRSAEKAVLR